MARAKRHRGGLAPDKYLSSAQIEQLLAYVRGEAARARGNGGTRAIANEMIVELLLGSGVRASELVSLEMRDLPHTHGKPIIFVRRGKGSVSRSVLISTQLAEKLTQFAKICRKGAKPGSPLFRSERGYRRICWTVRRRLKITGEMVEEGRSENSSRLTYASLYSRIRLIGKKAGIGKLMPHMLRHTHLSLLYAMGQDLRNVQDQAGHSDPKTTAIYAQTSEPARRRQIEAVGSALSGETLNIL